MRAKWILIGVAVSALAVGAWWANGARTYDALAFGGVGSIPDDARWVRQDGDLEIALAPWRSGQDVRYAVSVHNGGGRTVRITGVGEEAADYVGRRDYQLSPVRVQMMPGDEGLAYEALVPFAPFDLGPDERKTFVLTERLPLCRHFEPNASMVVRSFDVRYRALVFSREQTIELSTPIHFQRGADCEEA